MRKDYKIDEAMEKMCKVDNIEESVIIIAEYPDIDYVLAYRGGTCQPWVAAWAYNKERNSWGQGHYFNTIENAIEYIRMKQNKPTYYRLEELASKAIDKVIENDPWEAEEWMREELDLDDDEVKYFGISETLDMVKGYEEEDDDDEW